MSYKGFHEIYTFFVSSHVSFRSDICLYVFDKIVIEKKTILS